MSPSGSRLAAATFTLPLVASREAQTRAAPIAEPASRISCSAGLSVRPQGGQLLLMPPARNDEEPRFLINGGVNTQLISHRNAKDWAAVRI